MNSHKKLAQDLLHEKLLHEIRNVARFRSMHVIESAWCSPMYPSYNDKIERTEYAPTQLYIRPRHQHSGLELPGLNKTQPFLDTFHFVADGKCSCPSFRYSNKCTHTDCIVQRAYAQTISEQLIGHKRLFDNLFTE